VATGAHGQVAEPTRRSGLGRGLDAVIPAGPREQRDPLPPYEDPLAGRLDELVDEVRRLGERVDDLVRATADSARRRLWHRRCGERVGRLVATARASAGQLVGIGTALALDVTDLAIGTARGVLDAAFGEAGGAGDQVGGATAFGEAGGAGDQVGGATAFGGAGGAGDQASGAGDQASGAGDQPGGT
jgi:hypothetical protein